MRWRFVERSQVLWTNSTSYILLNLCECVLVTVNIRKFRSPFLFGSGSYWTICYLFIRFNIIFPVRFGWENIRTCFACQQIWWVTSNSQLFIGLIAATLNWISSIKQTAWNCILHDIAWFAWLSIRWSDFFIEHLQCLWPSCFIRFHRKSLTTFSNIELTNLIFNWISFYAWIA